LTGACGGKPSGRLACGNSRGFESLVLLTVGAEKNHRRLLVVLSEAGEGIQTLNIQLGSSPWLKLKTFNLL
jgi:hypothetical protein